MAALRLAERQKLKGIIVVAGYDSDLGDENERASGYFDRPFNWTAIRENCRFVAAVGGTLVGSTAPELSLKTRSLSTLLVDWRLSQKWI